MNRMGNDSKSGPMQSEKKNIYDILARETVHPFPARMAPDVALEVLETGSKSLSVLDPMMGSGTVPAVARSNGHRAFGVDIDPLAVLISKVWTTAIDVTAVREKANEVLDRARHRFSKTSIRDAYPRDADPETRAFVVYWFDEYSRRQLASLAHVISNIRDIAMRDVFWCSFSRLIIAKQSGASLALDLAHSRPHRAFSRAPAKPFTKFFAAVDRVIENCVGKNTSGRGPAPRLFEADARELPLRDETIDLVLTSPPYLNAIDYMRCSKFSLIWMGHTIPSLRQLRTESVGTEAGDRTLDKDKVVREIMKELNLRPALQQRHKAILARYIDDMRRSLSEVARVLVPGGRAFYVVGENTIRGTYIRNSKIIEAVAGNAGLKLTDSRTRALPGNRRYLPPPTTKAKPDEFDSRMRREVVLSFRKPKPRATH